MSPDRRAGRRRPQQTAQDGASLSCWHWGPFHPSWFLGWLHFTSFSPTVVLSGTFVSGLGISFQYIKPANAS